MESLPAYCLPAQSLTRVEYGLFLPHSGSKRRLALLLACRGGLKLLLPWLAGVIVGIHLPGYAGQASPQDPWDPLRPRHPPAHGTYIEAWVLTVQLLVAPISTLLLSSPCVPVPVIWFQRTDRKWGAQGIQGGISGFRPSILTLAW